MVCPRKGWCVGTVIRIIAAVDEELGMLPTHRGSSWNLKADKQYFKDKTTGSAILMGFNTYESDLGKKPLPDRSNLVAVRPETILEPGFEPVNNVADFLRIVTTNLWIIGGAVLFSEAIPFVQELYMTEVEGKHDFPKKFPTFSEQFELVEQGNPITENGITLRFNIYRRKG